MPYVDTDFILALEKKDDWLAKKANEVLEDFEGDLWTSEITFLELLFKAGEYNMNSLSLFASVFEYVEIENLESKMLIRAAFLFEKMDFKPCDALHTIHVENQKSKIISSDDIFDSDACKFERINLENY